MIPWFFMHIKLRFLTTQHSKYWFPTNWYALLQTNQFLYLKLVKWGSVEPLHGPWDTSVLGSYQALSKIFLKYPVYLSRKIIALQWILLKSKTDLNSKQKLWGNWKYERTSPKHQQLTISQQAQYPFIACHYIGLLIKCCYCIYVFKCFKTYLILSEHIQ